MVEGIKRATGSLGDVLKDELSHLRDSTRKRQVIMTAKTNLSTMGTIYSVFNMHHASSGQTGHSDKVRQILSKTATKKNNLEQFKRSYPQLAKQSLGYFTLTNPIRYYCLSFISSKVKVALDMLFILAFTFVALFADFKKMQSRLDSPIAIESSQLKTFLYFMHTWFAVGSCAGIVALGMINSTGAYLHSMLNLIDITLAIMGLFRVDFMASLNILRLARVISLISLHPRMEFLHEVLQLITESLGLLVSSLGIMLICTMFLAMFINNIIVLISHLGQRSVLKSLQVLEPRGNFQDKRGAQLPLQLDRP